MNENKEQQIPSDDSQDMRDNSQPAEPTRPDGAPVLSKNDELLEMGTTFDFDGFQVVRREFFAHLNEPSVSFNNYKFYVNTACLSKFPETEYVQVLVNRKTKILALRPCEEGERDSFLWCNNTNGKRKPKQTTCKLFFAKVISLMNWNPDYRYKLTGKLIHAKGEYLIAFDLTATEVYQRTFPEGAKPKTSKTPVFPSEWQDQFGLKNRFRCVVKVDDIDEVCYVSSSCRLENFIDLHSKEVQLTPSMNSNKLKHTLFSTYEKQGKKFTLLNLSIANSVVFEQLHRRMFSFLGRRKLARREAFVEGYKADIFIEDTGTAIEIKTIIASSKKAIFPSVKSERGLKQLEQIKVLLEKGYRVCYMFVSLSPEVTKVVLDRAAPFYSSFMDCVNFGMSYYGCTLKIQNGEIAVASTIKVET